MDALQELVLLEVERLASIGYANNIQKEAINTASFSGCILNPGHGKDSSPGFQFLYTKRQISNIIKV